MAWVPAGRGPGMRGRLGDRARPSPLRRPAGERPGQVTGRRPMEHVAGPDRELQRLDLFRGDFDAEAELTGDRSCRGLRELARGDGGVSELRPVAAVAVLEEDAQPLRPTCPVHRGEGVRRTVRRVGAGGHRMRVDRVARPARGRDTQSLLREVARGVVREACVGGLDGPVIHGRRSPCDHPEDSQGHHGPRVAPAADQVDPPGARRVPVAHHGRDGHRARRGQQRRPDHMYDGAVALMTAWARSRLRLRISPKQKPTIAPHAPPPPAIPCVRNGRGGASWRPG